MSVFFDTNVFLYATEVGPKSDVARDCLAGGGIISVQILNELVNVLQRKYRRSWLQIADILEPIYTLFGEPRPITLKTHLTAVALSRDHKVSFYDALIVASALETKCTTLCTEDLQDGRKFGDLSIINPFR